MALKAIKPTIKVTKSKKPKPIKVKKTIYPGMLPVVHIKKPKAIRLPNGKKIGTSKIERVFGLWLNDIGIEVTEQFNLGYKFYDFKVVGRNILIEFDGDYYHCNPEVFTEGAENKMQKEAIINDKYKDQLAVSNGYKLIRVWEKDFKENPKAVKERLLKEVNG